MATQDGNGKERVKKPFDIKHIADDIGKAAAAAAADAVVGVSKTALTVAEKTRAMTAKSQQALVSAIDQNGNGSVDIEDIIIVGLKLPGIRVDREDFLRKEFRNKLSQETIDDAVAYNPLHAKISQQLIDKIADDVIKYERYCVSGISAVLGAPGGAALAATIPADIAQFYGYLLRAVQKLMYLYGFPEIDMEEKGKGFDSETLNVLIVCMGVMYGVAGANSALKAMAKALAAGVEKQLMKKALTKGTIYPIVKSVSTWFGKKMTKEVFAGFFKKAIPLMGSVVGGGITFFSFKSCCEKLKTSLKQTALSDPNYCAADDEALEFIEVKDIVMDDVETDASEE